MAAAVESWRSIGPAAKRLCDPARDNLRIESATELGAEDSRTRDPRRGSAKWTYRDLPRIYIRSCRLQSSKSQDPRRTRIDHIGGSFVEFHSTRSGRRSSLHRTRSFRRVLQDLAPT